MKLTILRYTNKKTGARPWNVTPLYAAIENKFNLVCPQSLRNAISSSTYTLYFVVERYTYINSDNLPQIRTRISLTEIDSNTRRPGLDNPFKINIKNLVDFVNFQNNRKLNGENVGW